MKNIKLFISQKSAFLFAILFGFMLFAEQGGTASAAANISFTATEVQYARGETAIRGYFFNGGDIGAVVNSAELEVNITDMDGNYIWNDSSYFPNVGVFVAPGEYKGHVFYIHNENAEGYVGPIKWNVGWSLHSS